MDPDDCFALLDLPRMAHLDEAVLRDRYHERVRGLIDAATGGGEEGRALHRAYEVISDPVQRLRHLLHLADPARTPGGGTALSSDLMELFSEVGAVLSRSDGLLARLSQTTSALGRALLAEEEAAVQLSLQAVLARLTTKWDDQLAGLPQLAPSDAKGLEAVLGRMRILQKWQAEVQGRLLRLLTG